MTGGALPAALASDWLASAWDQNAFSRVSSPAAAAIEAVAERWVLEALGLPDHAAVGFTTGATMGNFTCLAAARHAVLERAGWDVEADGLAGAPPIRIVVGEHVHASMIVALRYLGLGPGRAERVPADAQGAMLADELSLGDGPTIVCAQAGEVNSGAFDPLAEIADACRASGAWLHVDGAFGLWAAVSPELRHLLRGAERADSWSVDCHKWLNVPYDGGLAIVADRDALRAAMGIQATYLPGVGRPRAARHGSRDVAPRALDPRLRGAPVAGARRSGRAGGAQLRAGAPGRGRGGGDGRRGGAQRRRPQPGARALRRRRRADPRRDRRGPARRRGVARRNGLARTRRGAGFGLQLVDDRGRTSTGSCAPSSTRSS